MTIVAAMRYVDGRPAGQVDFDKPCDGEGGHGFEWIGLHAPTIEEMSRIAARYSLHPLAVEDAVTGRQLPKIESYARHLFLVMRTAALEERGICYGETAIFVGRDFLVTVRLGSERGHSPLRAQLESNPALLAHGPDYVLHAILDYLVDGYFPIVDTLEDEVLGVEAQSLDRFPNPDALHQLFSVRRDLVRFQRMLGPTEETVGRLIHVEYPEIDKATLPYFRDVLDHVRRANFRVTGLREVLNSVLEASSMMEQHRQGIITRQLAAWAAILAVPTAIAGIYGMNFEHMPELHWKYGYFFVLGVMACVCGGLYMRFKKSGWL